MLILVSLRMTLGTLDLKKHTVSASTISHTIRIRQLQLLLNYKYLKSALAKYSFHSDGDATTMKH